MNWFRRIGFGQSGLSGSRSVAGIVIGILMFCSTVIFLGCAVVVFLDPQSEKMFDAFTWSYLGVNTIYIASFLRWWLMQKQSKNEN